MEEVNTINWNQKCWRYFKLDRFINCLKNGNMYFAAANQFQDDFEGSVNLQSPNSIPNSSNNVINMVNNAFKSLQRLTKISCWHKADYESDAMWKLYAQERKGIAISTTPEKMKQAFKAFRLKPEYCIEEIYIGNVQYVDLTTQYINDTMLNIFFYKHLVYSFENELRLVISLRLAEEFGMQVPEKGIFVQVDYTKLIDDIIIGPEINSEDREELRQVCIGMGLESKLRDSCLTWKPRFY